MPSNRSQRVFGFVTEEPVGQQPDAHAQLGSEFRERIGWPLYEETFEKLWRERIGPMIEKEIARRVEKLVAERLAQALGTIEMALEQTMIRLDNHLTCHSSPAEDTADWWKRGECPPGSDVDDLPA